jgi:hypothetical protein
VLVLRRTELGFSLAHTDEARGLGNHVLPKISEESARHSLLFVLLPLGLLWLLGLARFLGHRLKVRLSNAGKVVAKLFRVASFYRFFLRLLSLFLLPPIRLQLVALDRAQSLHNPVVLELGPQHSGLAWVG